MKHLKMKMKNIENLQKLKEMVMEKKDATQLVGDIVAEIAKNGERIELQDCNGVNCLLIQKYYNTQIELAKSNQYIVQAFEMQEKLDLYKQLKIQCIATVYTKPTQEVRVYEDNSIMINGIHYDESLEDVLEMVQISNRGVIAF